MGQFRNVGGEKPLGVSAAPTRRGPSQSTSRRPRELVDGNGPGACVVGCAVGGLAGEHTARATHRAELAR
jgi:hypothetical protein